MEANFKIKLSFYLFVFLSLPKTIYFNLRALPLRDALRLPILIGYNYKLKKVRKGVVKFSNDKPANFSVKFGHNGSAGPLSQNGEIRLQCGTLLFKGSASFAKGCSLRVAGNLEIGDGFTANSNCTIMCFNDIRLGKQVMLGWNVTILDSDGHKVFVNSEQTNKPGSIHVGNHTWLCSESHLLKGASVGNDCIVAYRSVLNKPYYNDNVLIAGSPAKIKREGVCWEF